MVELFLVQHVILINIGYAWIMTRPSIPVQEYS